MYTPKHFDAPVSPIVHEIIERNNFATMIMVKDKVPIVSHLPFFYPPERTILLGHMARANPQWRIFTSAQEALVIFQGPHAYISPRWYQPQPDNVPTWNYAVVHVRGIPKILQDDAAAFKAMEALVKHQDPDWQLSLSDQIRREMMREIVVFEIGITTVEAKFKLSQNRSEKDLDCVSSELLNSSDQRERETGALMERIRS